MPCLEVDSIRIVAIPLIVEICVVVWLVEIVEPFSVTVDETVVFDVIVVVGSYVDVIVVGIVEIEEFCNKDLVSVEEIVVVKVVSVVLIGLFVVVEIWLVVEISVVVGIVEVVGYVSMTFDESIIIGEVEVLMLGIREAGDGFVCVNGHGS